MLVDMFWHWWNWYTYTQIQQSCGVTIFQAAWIELDQCLALCALIENNDVVLDDEEDEDIEDEDNEEDEDKDLASDDDTTLLSGGGATHGSDGRQAGQTGLNSDKDGSLSTKTQPAVVSTGSLKPPPHMRKLTQVKLNCRVSPCDRQEK